MSFDIDSADAAIDRLIESRSAEKREANWVEEEERRRGERYILGRGEEIRKGWVGHHRRQAETFERLAEKHRRALFELMDMAAQRS